MKFDYLIVGAGLTGMVFARELTDAGKKCLVVEKRDHIGGNIYTAKTEGIDVHQYGPHIFHTENEKIWQYACGFGKMNHFINSPMANYQGKLFNLPFNMNTFYQMWGCTTPKEAQAKIEGQRLAHRDLGQPKNLEEQAIALVGRDIYEKLIKGYTVKQWGRSCSELPPSIIKRLPVRFTFDNNYFSHPYQGIPADGYTAMAEKFLEGVEVRLSSDYFLNRAHYNTLAPIVIYTGCIDEFFDFQLGALAYRSIDWDTKTLEEENFQGNAVINYTDLETPYTRVIEHKHFNFGKQPKTVVSWEYSREWAQGAEPYYPVNDQQNNDLYRRYHQLAQMLPGVIFCGRLAEYQYYDMDKTIEMALEKVGELLRA